MTALEAFDFPFPPGLETPGGLGKAGAPGPELGRLVCAVSTLDVEGNSVLPEDAPRSPGRRLLVALAVAVIAGCFLGLSTLLVLPAEQVSEHAAPLFALTSSCFGACAFALVLRAYGHSSREGTVAYAGTEGVTVLKVSKGAVVHTATGNYAEAFAVLRSASKVVVNGTSSFQSEMVSLRNREGERTVSVGGTFARAEHPSAMALFAREVAYLAAQKRLRVAHANLSGGEPVEFPLFAGNQLTSRRVVVHPHHIEVRDHRTRTVERSFRLGEVMPRVAQGTLELAPRSADFAGVSFLVETLGDVDVLVSLVGTHQSV